MNQKIIYTICLSLFYVLTSFAQLHVDEDQDVGIGVEDTDSSKMVVKNNSNNYSLQLSNNVVNDAAKYGAYNLVGEEGVGVKYGIYNVTRQNVNSTLNLFGIRNESTNNGTGISYGLYNQIDESGNSIKYGIVNFLYQNSASSKNVYGVYQKIYNKGSGGTSGNHCFIDTSGTGGKTGYYSEIRQNQNSTNSISGFVSQLYPKSTSSTVTQGIYNYIAPDINFTGIVYGARHYIVNAGAGMRYGVYSNISGGSGYAGYFVGDVIINGINTASDEKLKRNIKDIGDCTAIIKNIKPRRYKFKKSKIYKDTEKEQFGFIAQELETILPELVSTVVHPNDDISYIEEEGLDGELISTPVLSNEPPETYKAINYTALIPIMMQALKEQQSQIEKQQAEIDRLIKEVEKISKK